MDQQMPTYKEILLQLQSTQMEVMRLQKENSVLRKVLEENGVEGFDYARLDTLFLALPISWKGLVAQYAGRLHRNYEGKNEVQIYDYVDIRVPVCDIMYRRRLKAYSSIAYFHPFSMWL